VSGDVWDAGTAGSGAGEFEETRAVSVDADGVVYVGDVNRVQRFTSSGAFLSQIMLSGDHGYPWSLVVDSSGDLYTAPNGTQEVFKYDPSGSLLDTFADADKAMAIDSFDDFFVFGEQGGARSITEYDAAGVILRRFGYEQAFGVEGLAVYHSSTGEIFADEQITGLPTGNHVWHIPFPPPGPIVFPTPPLGSGNGEPDVTRAAKVGNASATLDAGVNPEGRETTYHFEYVDQKGFEAGGFSSPATKVTPEAPVGSDFDMHALDAVVDVAPETTYHFRLVAINPDGTSTGPEATFTSLPPLQLGDTWTVDVGGETATLHAEVNPLGIPTHGYFEYVDDSTFKESGFAEAHQVPDFGGGATPLDFGSGEALQERSAQLFQLQAATTYDYRIVAFDGFVTVASPPRAFTTFGPAAGSDQNCFNQALRGGASSALPDCRAYEIVSPVDKNGGDVLTLLTELNFNARLDQSAVSGEAITFSSYRAFAGAQSGGWSTQYLARRGADGWSTEAISPPKGEASGAGHLPLDTTFDAFSADLSTAWLYDEGAVLDTDAPGGFYNLFSRDDATGAYTAQIRAVPPHQFNNNGNGLPELQGVSADGRHMVFRASDNLVSPAPEVSKTQLYEAYREGEEPPQLRLVSILPNKAPATTGASAGIGNTYSRRTANVNHAVSEDGSRVYWTAAESGPAPIYVRVDGTETLPVSEAIKPVDSSPARFWAASADGSRALYDYTASTHSGDLYEYGLASKKSTLVAAKFLGLLGASEDLSRFYFLSDEALTADATAGKPNLYLDEEGVLTYIAALSVHDAKVTSGKTPTPVSIEPYFHTARISSDGRSLAFTSDSAELAEAVAGYDNTDQQSGEADAEVYHYAAGRLVCVSCNPTGARPSGREVLFGNQHTKAWAAARLPGYAMQTYQSRYLSDDGTHLYFDSDEALLPRDTNGKQDVYEWEAPGSGDCSEESASFDTRIGGCLSLISTGESPRDSEFIDASPTGRDVFFVTLSSLVPQDPGLIDLYDAREDGGYPSPQGLPASCEGEACQGSPAAPNDPSPASAFFSGPGDLVPALTPVVQPREKTAAQVRAEQLARALKQCRRMHASVKRKKCEATARKRYGTQSNSKAKKSNSRGK
jgi:hypothetical protein